MLPIDRSRAATIQQAPGSVLLMWSGTEAEHDSLYVLGFVEFADAAYKRFDEMAQLIMIDIHARETGSHRAEIAELKRADRPDLRGGVSYVDSPRHTNYVERATYMAYLAWFRDRFDWHDIDNRTFESLRVSHADDPTGEVEGLASAHA